MCKISPLQRVLINDLSPFSINKKIQDATVVEQKHSTAFAPNGVGTTFEDAIHKN